MIFKKSLLSILFYFLFNNTSYSQFLKNFTSSFESNSAYYTDDSKTDCDGKEGYFWDEWLSNNQGKCVKDMVWQESDCPDEGLKQPQIPQDLELT